MSEQKFIKLTNIPWKRGSLTEEESHSCVIRISDIKYIRVEYVWIDSIASFKPITKISLDRCQESIFVTESVDTIYDKLEKINNKEDLYEYNS